MCMTVMTEEELQDFKRQSSKGNQLKWKKEEVWYKADYTGYEGLAEYMVSQLLAYSTLSETEYVVYQTEQMQYKRQEYLGCSSRNFLKKGWRIVTLERLFKQRYGTSLMEAVYRLPDCEARIRFLVEQTIRMTGLTDFGVYLSKLLTVDAFFLNEDRHMHNIAVCMDENERFWYCPIFDNGAALLSDTTMDYPLQGDVDEMIEEVEAKTFSRKFDEQLDTAELLYGCQLHFSFTAKDVSGVLEKEPYYPPEITDRVLYILRNQMRKYQYLFAG